MVNSGKMAGKAQRRLPTTMKLEWLDAIAKNKYKTMKKKAQDRGYGTRLMSWLST